LRNWNGVTETRYFDSENRPVDSEASSARPVDLIPLALYGLDHPKIPALLVDFRKPLNAKRRELSARARDAVIENLVPASSLTKVAQNTAHLITRRKGTDLFQPSRARSYSQLKTLLALDSRISPGMRAEIARRIESIADNPLENDVMTELQLARNQYQSLLNYALRPDGLGARLQRDRRAELAAGTHRGVAKVLWKLAEVSSLGIYKHREADQPELLALLETQRRTVHHEQFLRTVVKSGSPIEIEWDLEKIRDSLRYLASNGAMAPKEIASVALEVFARTEDEYTRRVCLDTIQKLDTPVAQSAFLRLVRDQKLADPWRALAAQYLRIPTGTPSTNEISSVQAAERDGTD
jgi:ribonuclease D